MWSVVSSFGHSHTFIDVKTRTQTTNERKRNEIEDFHIYLKWFHFFCRKKQADDKRKISIEFNVVGPCLLWLRNQVIEFDHWIYVASE